MQKNTFTDTLGTGLAVVVIVLRTIWCACTSFISPVLLVIIYLCLSGRVYQVDAAFDEGTAGIIGIILSAVWIIAVLVPDILYIVKMKSYDKKFMWIALGFAVVIPALICCGICRWDIVRYLTTPISNL